MMPRTPDNDQHRHGVSPGAVILQHRPPALRPGPARRAFEQAYIRWQLATDVCNAADRAKRAAEADLVDALLAIGTGR